MKHSRRIARPTALILGTNEIASAVAVRMRRAGFACVLSHDPFPPVIRRGMAFHDALFGETVVLEGFAGRRADGAVEVFAALDDPDAVAVSPLAVSDLIALRMPDALIDARLQKYSVTPDWRHIAKVTVGLGPNFAVGVNCDVAIETRPDHVGRILRRGATEPGDHSPRDLGGVGAERFVYADSDGPWRTALDFGARVYKGMVIGRLGGTPVTAPRDGVLRGVLRDGLNAFAGAKLLEIDPRGRNAAWTGIDERGEIIARAVVEAVRLKHAEREARFFFAPLAAQ